MRSIGRYFTIIVESPWRNFPWAWIDPNTSPDLTFVSTGRLSILIQVVTYRETTFIIAESWNHNASWLELAAEPKSSRPSKVPKKSISRPFLMIHPPIIHAQSRPCTTLNKFSSLSLSQNSLKIRFVHMQNWVSPSLTSVRDTTCAKTWHKWFAKQRWTWWDPWTSLNKTWLSASFKA